MRLKVFLPCALSLIATFFPNIVHADPSIVWMTDYQAALEKSCEQKRPLLLYFTASDFSGWCMKLKNEVFNDPQFAQAVADQFICVEIDFPKSKPLPKSLAAQNEQLRQAFGIKEFPRVLVQGDQKRVLLKTGYLPGGALQYANYLLGSVQKDRDLTRFLGGLKSQTPSAKLLEKHYLVARELRRDDDAALILEVGLRTVESSFFLLEKYKYLVENEGLDAEKSLSFREKISKMDPSNKHGLQFSLAMIAFQELSKTEPSVKAVKPLEAYLTQFGSEDEHNAWRVEMMIAQAYLEEEQCTRALDHAKVAFEKAPQERRQEIGQSIDYIKAQRS